METSETSSFSSWWKSKQPDEPHFIDSVTTDRNGKTKIKKKGHEGDAQLLNGYPVALR